ncbi:MAG: DnaB-like helicase C-terminal domain-containing protein, partial [Phycisphaerales bacterium]
SMGKTALGLSIAQYLALQERKGVVFFSMEMSNDQVAQRIISSYTGIESQKFRRRQIGALSNEMKNILNACADFKDAPLFIDDTPGMTAMELRSKARRLKQRADIQ